jgi:hypothetical protein
VKRKPYSPGASGRAYVSQAQEIKDLREKLQAADMRERLASRAVNNSAKYVAVYLEALRDLMGFFDKVQGSSGNWTVAEVKRIEAIRLLSLGV